MVREMIPLVIVTHLIFFALCKNIYYFLHKQIYISFCKIFSTVFGDDAIEVSGKVSFSKSSHIFRRSIISQSWLANLVQVSYVALKLV